MTVFGIEKAVPIILEAVSAPKRPTEGHKLLRLDGQSYFAISRAIRTECKVTTIARLPRMGKKAPWCYENLGTVLALLDQIASCAWGCPGTEEGHAPHRLIGRGVSNGNTGIELALIGQYDEALVTARSVGEFANLLWLYLKRSTSATEERVAAAAREAQTQLQRYLTDERLTRQNPRCVLPAWRSCSTAGSWCTATRSPNSSPEGGTVTARFPEATEHGQARARLASSWTYSENDKASAIAELAR